MARRSRVADSPAERGAAPCYARARNRRGHRSDETHAYAIARPGRGDHRPAGALPGRRCRGARPHHADRLRRIEGAGRARAAARTRRPYAADHRAGQRSLPAPARTARTRARQPGATAGARGAGDAPRAGRPRAPPQRGQASRFERTHHDRGDRPARGRARPRGPRRGAVAARHDHPGPGAWGPPQVLRGTGARADRRRAGDRAADRGARLAHGTGLAAA